MLSIQPPASSSSSSPSSIPKLTPNVLPCRINYTGPVNASKRYWNVEQDDKDRKVAYFRGRKLFGREVKLNENYQGVVVRDSNRSLPQSSLASNSKLNTTALNYQEDEKEEEDDDEDEPEPIKVLEEVATFDEIMVWGHEHVPGEDDVFVRGVQEWIAFAEAMHSVDDEVDTSKG